MEDKYFGVKVQKDRKIKTTKKDVSTEEINEAQRLTNKQQTMLRQKIIETKNAIPRVKLDRLEYKMMTRDIADAYSILDVKTENEIDNPLLGVVESGRRCPTCKMTSTECPGHFGIINIGESMVHPAFRTFVIYTLQSICKNCACLYLSEEELKISGILNMSGLARLKEISDKSKNKPCPLCRQNNSIEFTATKNSGKEISWVILGTDRKDKTNPKVITFGPSIIKKIFHSIRPEDLKLLGYNRNHPENFVNDFIMVLPPASRPKVYREGQEILDSLTLTYLELVKTVREGSRLSEQGNGRSNENTSILMKYSALVEGKGEKPVSIRRANDKYKDITTRMKGKDGLMRNNLLGKRNDHSARSVLGPNKDIMYGTIALPKIFRQTLVVPEIVTKYNRKKIISLALRGEIVSICDFNGCEYPRFKETRDMDKLILKNKVYRKLSLGDYVVFNRQPTLHKQSMLAYPIGEFQEKDSIGIHLSSTTGHNADFDGDEGNIHVPQTIKARVECEFVAQAKYSLMSEYIPAPAVGLTYNSVLGAYLLTTNDISIELFEEGLELLHRNETFRENSKTIYERIEALENMGYKINKSSGKILCSVMLPPDFYYTKFEDDKPLVVIRNGIIVSGYLSKQTIGVSGGSIIQELWKRFPIDNCTDFISYSTFLFNWYLLQSGFTISIDDCRAPNDEKFREENDRLLDALNQGILSLPKLPDNARDFEKELREREIITRINNKVSEIKDKTMKIMSKTNPLVLMAKSKSKGTVKEISRIVATVEAQMPNGGRPKKTLNGGKRCIKTFSIDDESIFSRGFIKNSFYDGLDPEEYFFTMQVSREGIINTAIKTGDVGDIQRKMIKTFEDLVVDYDGSVRNQVGMIFQYSYNFNPSETTLTKDGSYFFINLKNVCESLNFKNGYDSLESITSNLLS